MDIAQAKQQVKSTVQAYLASDEAGLPRLPSSEQRPLFLVGAPGIGKTAIMEQVADELGVGLVAYSMTHHTRQSALGLPFIVHKSYRGGREFDISEYTMSEIIASIYDYMEQTGLDKGILFLDEINCVSETLYPSMLQFLQFKKFGRHEVPREWVVVCAGNPPEYNRSVHEFDIVTLDRLRRIDVEPSLPAWRDYQRTRRSHPAITTYLDLLPDDFYLVESTPEGKRFVSARSWTELGDLMLLLEDLKLPVDADVVSQFVQHPEVAARFSAYYDLFVKYRSDYQVDAILAGNASQDIIARAGAAPLDERLALVALLLDAIEQDAHGLLERQDSLEFARDALRDAKGSEAFAATMLEVADKSRASAAIGTEAAKRIAARRAVLLEQMVQSRSYEEAAQAYRELVGLHGKRVESAQQRIEAAYGFIEEVFGVPELLMFTTELTARRDTAQFIAQFGSDAYFRHNEALATEAERDAIFEEIDSLM